jgi:acyl carrier protein
MDAATRAKVMSVLEKETNVDLATVNPDLPIREQIVIDSMMFISMIARLELELDVNIPSEIMGVETLNQFLAQVEAIVDTK